MTKGSHIRCRTPGFCPQVSLGLLLLSRLWACLWARPLGGDQRPDTRNRL